MAKLTQYKILLVDDKSENLFSLSAILKKAGYQTDSALSGKEALKLLLKNEYGLLILDVQMPEMNGFELAELIKGNSKTKDIPLIFLSANAVQKEFFKKGHEAGALDYLTKPVDESLLLLKIKNFLDLHHSKLELFEANKLLEKRAIQAHISYQDLYYSLEQDIYILNKEGVIISINRNGKLICGLTVHDLIDQHYSKSPFLAEILGSTNKKINILSYFENADHTAKHIEFKVHLNPQSTFYGEAVITVAVIEGKHLIQIAITDETEIKKQALFLKQINDSVNVKTGASYFSEFTKFCCEKLGVKYAMVGNYIRDENAVESISFRNTETEFPIYRYDLKNTPCSMVLEGAACVYPNNVQASFPKDEDLKNFGIESYLGMPLLDEDNNPIGIIVLLHDKPMEDVLQKEKLLSFLAPRTVNELISIKTNQKLKESELFNRGVLSSLSSQIAVIDKLGNLISVNDAWRNFSLLNGETNLKRTCTECNYFEVCEKAIDQGDIYSKGALDGIKSVLNKNVNRFEMEYPCDSPDKKRWFILSVSGFEGNSDLAVIRHIDITERKRKEEVQKVLLHISNFSGEDITLTSFFDKVREELSDLFGTEGFYVAVNDKPNKTINFLYSADYINNELKIRTNFNRPYSKGFTEYILESKKALFLNANDFDKFHLEHPEVIPQGIKSLSWMGAPLLTKGKISGVLGIQSYLNKSPFSKSDADFIAIIAGLIGTAIEKLEAQQFLKSNEERFRTLFERNLAGVYRSDMNSVIIECNDAFAQIIGLQSSKDVIGKHARELYVNISHPNFDESLKKNDGKVTLEEGIIQRKNGEKVYLLENATIVNTDEGEAKYMEGTIINITERKKQEVELQKTVLELNNKNNELMQFNYIVSHNLRAPVANILGLANLLNLSDTNEDDKNKITNYIYLSTLKMDEQIKDLSLVLSLRNPINEKKEYVNICFLINSILDTLLIEIKKSGIVIKIEVSNHVKELFTIKSYLESILYNLISNAIKYKSPKLDSEILISIQDLDECIMIKVSDNGIGIDLNQHGQYIFGLYKRFNDNVQGKGLGLHMTKTQVEALGGSIVVESEINKGSTFIIKLPKQ